jgi:hypothetical protein
MKFIRSFAHPAVLLAVVLVSGLAASVPARADSIPCDTSFGGSSKALVVDSAVQSDVKTLVADLESANGDTFPIYHASHHFAFWGWLIRDVLSSVTSPSGSDTTGTSTVASTSTGTSSTTTVPEPSSLALLAIGLVGLGGVKRKFAA